MIHPAILPFIKEESSGAGFRRKTLIRCFSGPHQLFDLIGEFKVHYSTGARCWVFQIEQNKAKPEFASFTAKTYIEAREKLDSGINAFYAHFLGKEQANANSSS